MAGGVLAGLGSAVISAALVQMIFAVFSARAATDIVGTVRVVRRTAV